MKSEGWQRLVLWGSFVFFLGALLLRQETAITQDLGRHLRLGEMIAAGGEARRCALFSNCLTYTYPDYPFINHHWGSEIIFYLVHKWAGFSGIIIFKAIVLGLTFLVTAYHALGFNKGPAFLKRPGLLRPAIAIILVFLSTQVMADRLTTRPEIFGYLLFSLLFWILNKSYIDDKRSLLIYITPLIILLWVNLHISFVFGLILVWIWAGTKMLGYRLSVVGYQFQVDRLSVGQSETDKPKTGKPEAENRKPKTDNWVILAIPVISTLVTIFNPAGLRGALMPLSILRDYGYTIVENMTPFFLRAFKPQPEYWIYTIILIVTIGLFLFSSAKKNTFHLLTFLTFSLFPLFAVRHLPFFALVIPVILTPLLKDRPANSGTILPWLTAGWLIIAGITNPVFLVNGKLPPIKLIADSRHDSAVEFVKQSSLQGPMWNNYDIGSYLEWKIPEHKTFVDGRPEAFPAGFFQKTYIPMQEDKITWDLITTKYDIQWAFVALTDATPWFTKWWQMIQSHQSWRIVYIDNFSAVLVKVDSQNNSIGPQGKAKTLELLTF